ncbi:hypothetical protein ACOSQ3_004324 [Xanthoceras sorbifolium]
MMISPLCSRCHKEPETILHAIWSCNVLQNLREKCSFWGTLPPVIDGSFLDSFMFCRSYLSPSNLQLLGIIFWKSWHLRNCYLHNQPSISLVDVLPWCREYLAEFVAASEIPTPVRVEHMVRWIPPLVGEFKLNSDVALDHLHGRTGLGAMLRNHCGEVLLSDLVSFDGILKPDVAEAKPVLFGVSMALEGGFTSFSIKSDAASIIKAF